MELCLICGKYSQEYILLYCPTCFKNYVVALTRMYGGQFTLEEIEQDLLKTDRKMKERKHHDASQN